MASLKAFSRNPGFTPVQANQVKTAISQDASFDLTSQSLKLSGNATAHIVAKQDGVLAGVPEANAAFKGLQVSWKLREGQSFRKGQLLAVVKGRSHMLMAAERTALDYLMVLSGVATQTRRWVAKYGSRVAATRKTHPHLSMAEKRAVEAGGGFTHRLSLADGYLIKENHVAVLALQEKLTHLQALQLAIARAKAHQRQHRAHWMVEVEVRNLNEALVAVSAVGGPDALLVDNCTPNQLRIIAQAVRRVCPSLLLEASGGITLENAGAYLRAGANLVSSRSLTLGAKPVDLSLLVQKTR